MADPDNSADGYATEALRQEMAAMTSTQRAAVLMLLLGEEQASDIIRFLNPKEVQALGAAMVQVQDLSQEAINVVLDEFVATIKKQTSLALGTADYVEKVFKRALGDAYRQVSDLRVKELVERRYERLQSYGRFTDTKASAK
jgi:flagellar motor switch protein FliG